jgi:hypothetical protein
MLSLLIKMSLKIARELIGRRCRLRDNFRSVPGCLHNAPRHELLRHQRPRQSAASANKRRISMEPALTQMCALYYAQHKTSKDRAELFKMFRAAARQQATDVRQQLTFGDSFIVPRLHKDNGR